MLRAISLAASLMLAGTACAQMPGFWLVGNAPNATQGSVTSLSQYGTMAGGLSSASSPYAPGFTWTADGGRQDLIGPGLPPGTAVHGMSSDGGVLAGYLLDSQVLHAYRRVGAGAFQDLGTLSGETRSLAWDVSGDGSTVVGHAEHSAQTNAYGQAFRWTESQGMQGLGYLKPGGTYSQAHGISRDGSTIVGVSQSGGPFGGPKEAFAWTQSGGMIGLPLITGATFPDTSAEAVSADGSVIVGAGGGPSGRVRAARWAGGGVQDLGVLAGMIDSHAYATSGDGTVIGGASTLGSTRHAFIWTPSTGMVPLSDFLLSHGLTVPSEYRLEYVYAISGDGFTFAGQVRNLTTNIREGFVTTIPAPSSLLVLLAPCFSFRRRRD